MKAALEVAARGERVYLVERAPFIGGEITYLERQFPTDRCCMCQMLPPSQRVPEGEYCLRRSFHHPRVEVLTSTEVVALEGERGRFRVTLRLHPRGVREDLCTACLKCLEACPVEAIDDFFPFGTRRAIYLRGPAPCPPIPAIDWSLCDRCARCAEACPTKAVDLGGSAEERVVEASSVILATGFVPFDPRGLGQYGYGRFPNVVTSLDFERLLSPLGPAKPLRPSDRRVARRVAFLLCIGSRQEGWEPCSSACCMIALKQARLLLEVEPTAEPVLFFMDLRAFGKGYHRYLRDALGRGVRLVRGRVPKVWEDPRTRDPILRYLDGDRIREESFDLTVLVTGQRPPEGFSDLVQRLGLEQDPWGFVKAQGVRTSRPGVYVCGPASGPKDIPETIVEATAAALEATRDLTGKGEPMAPWSPPEDSPEEVALLLCRCGGEIAAEAIAEATKGLFPEVKLVDFLCREEVEVKGDRLVIGACAPYWFKRRVLSNLPLEPWKVEWVNLRDIFRGQEEALDTVIGAVIAARQRALKATFRPSAPWEPQRRALVLGGGLTGLEVALQLAERGIGVVLLEKGTELGGAYRSDPRVSEDIQEMVARLSDLGVEVFTGASLKDLKGVAGDFQALVEAQGETEAIPVGAVVVAVGARPYRPEGYPYGKDPRIMTQADLRKVLASGGLDPKGVRSVVMIQCVGQRDERRPWCSRFCCEEAVRNALLLKELNPGGDVFVLHRDLMTYGLKESLYFEARRKGVVFLREEGKIDVDFSSPMVVKGRDFALEADLLVLSVGEEPGEDFPRLAEVLKVPLTPEGFFQEAEPKFRPVDALRDGIYLCGGCRGPRTFEEARVEARAVAQRVLTLLGAEASEGLVVSFVDERRCSGCGLCVEACPYGARSLDEEERVAKVKAPICQGCGVCSALCPNGAAKLQGFAEGQMLGVVESMVSRR